MRGSAAAPPGRAGGRLYRSLPFSSGALDWTRTSTSFRTQALNLPRIPFRHEGKLARLVYADLFGVGNHLLPILGRHAFAAAYT